VPRRVLSAEEGALLAMIQQSYGPQNTADTVFLVANWWRTVAH
jgi:hypothetical protein